MCAFVCTCFFFFFFPRSLSVSLSTSHSFFFIFLFLLSSSSFFFLFPNHYFSASLYFSSSFLFAILSFSLGRTLWFLSFILPNRRCDMGPQLVINQCGIDSVCRWWVSFLAMCSVLCGFLSRSKTYLGLNVNPLPPHFLISLSLYLG